MLKSYQESGGASPPADRPPCAPRRPAQRLTTLLLLPLDRAGTTLSTNWAEIGQKQTEVKPPDGMVAKKWE